MAEKDIIQKLISQPGQSQDMRMPKELDIHFADLDERTAEETLSYASKFSELVNFFKENTSAPTGDWKGFFPSDESEIRLLLSDPDGKMAPHLALFLAFRSMYGEGAMELMNRITGRHLDFYFKDILRLELKPAIPDKVHLLPELKKNSSAVLIRPSDQLTAGKDAIGRELIYSPLRETVINGSKVELLQSVFYDKSGKGIIRFAPVANSSDGIGGKLKQEDPQWPGFGNELLPPLENGFAFASPILKMKEGTRKIQISLTLDNADQDTLSETALKGALEAYVSGEKNWIGPFSLKPTWQKAGNLLLEFTVPETEKAIVGYNQTIHGYRYSSHLPIVQVLLNVSDPAVSIGYNDLNELGLQGASLSVEVTGIHSLALENDLGAMPSDKPFNPFGSIPVKGSRFHIGNDEALSKNLTELSIELNWKNPPANFATHYQAYQLSVNNDSFTAHVAFDYGDNKHHSKAAVGLFNSVNATQTQTLTFISSQPTVSASFSTGKHLVALKNSGSAWSKVLIKNFITRRPYLELFTSAALPNQPGFITFTLNHSFYHAEFRKKSVENVVNFVTGAGDPPSPYVALNEPYTPTVQKISLSYKASTGEVPISSVKAEDFSNDALDFFHLAYSGQMIEHAYQRNQFSYLVDKSVSLFPSYPHEGEMLIGISKLNPGDSVSILFQVAEGSEDPDIPQQEISWSVLSDNYWKPLSKSEVVLDSTNGLLTSGIIQFVIPTDATTEHTLLKPGLIWLKAGMIRNITAVCNLLSIDTNAIEAVFTNNGNDPNHLLTALEAGKIKKFRDGVASIKSVSQPYSSFGGSSIESDKAFYTRVSERLRHKNRSITSWDYERMILESFPGIHKVKCIPHARYFDDSKKYCWLAPGYVLIVAVPDLRNKNAVNPLQPKVNGQTISQVTGMINKHSGMQVNIRVKNPRYQQIRVECKVKLRPGYEFNFFSEEISRKLVEFLSPWAFDGNKEISFGGKIYKSVLLNFVEELDCVDFIEDFFLYSISDAAGTSDDLQQVEPETPDTILVSAPSHFIHEVK
ncbi:MAG: baseplate J/gp47 family protein [Bacteroidales bacterium]|nr:baseplate J/gp47 family protein [Bacteroidales bacterium]